MARDTLSVSEVFYSIQGEGRWIGKPAVFLRLAGCNLTCQGWSYDRHLHDVTAPTDSEQGAEKPSGQVVLRAIEDSTPSYHIQHLGCDTAHVWKHGERFTFDALLDDWDKQGYLDLFQCGAHLIVTGGEPMLQQDAVWDFIDRLDAAANWHVYVEVETNGTIQPQIRHKRGFPFTRNRGCDWFNLSPKLTSAGDPRAKQYKEDVLSWFADETCTAHDVCWKFVTDGNPFDIEEIEQDYIERFELLREHFWLMPEGGTRERLLETGPIVAELCKAHGYNFSPRLQVDLWNETTGV